MSVTQGPKYQNLSGDVTKDKVGHFSTFVSFQFNVMIYNPIGRPTLRYFQFPVNSEHLTITDGELKEVPCQVSDNMWKSFFSLMPSPCAPSSKELV